MIFLRRSLTGHRSAFVVFAWATKNRRSKRYSVFRSEPKIEPNQRSSGFVSISLPSSSTDPIVPRSFLNFSRCDILPDNSIEKKERKEKRKDESKAIWRFCWIGKQRVADQDSVGRDSMRGVAIRIRSTGNNSCTRARGNPGRSMATAALHDHVFVLLQYNVAFVEEIQHWDRRELGRGAARLWYLTRADQVHQGLDDRVIGRVHMGVQREIALAAAIICVVSVRCYDPVLEK